MHCDLEVHEVGLEVSVGITDLVEWLSMLGVRGRKRLKVAVEAPLSEAKKVEKLSLRNASVHETSAQVDAIHDEDVEECEIDPVVMPGSVKNLG